VTTPPRHAWLDGRIVDWDRCVLHARAPGAFWGANVFEGLRGYWRPEEGELYLFRVADHLARLRRSMAVLRMEVAYTDADIVAACRELLRANEFEQDCHVTVVGYFGLGSSFDPMVHTDVTGMHITAAAVPRSASYRDGATVGFSSWRRIGDDSMPPRVKTGANYHNSRLAQHEANRNGYHTALLLNQRGTVAEAPGACMVMVHGGALVTPPGTSGVLEGITLATVEELARAELGMAMHRREIDRTELYLADEVFLCGTMAEILPVVSLDQLPVGDGAPGPVTRALQGSYEGAVRANPGYRHWRSPVYASAESGDLQPTPGGLHAGTR
jgi:branched-chain amino acid aminotransferase